MYVCPPVYQHYDSVRDLTLWQHSDDSRVLGYYAVSIGKYPRFEIVVPQSPEASSLKKHFAFNIPTTYPSLWHNLPEDLNTPADLI
jgi:hypothetical protein